MKVIDYTALNYFDTNNPVVLRLGLFIPCYIDQFYPQVGISTLQLLEKFGCQVEYPTEQTCCGQPLANSGFALQSRQAENHFTKVFWEYDYIVCPSASCAYHVRHHLLPGSETSKATEVRKRTLDLVEFLVDILRVDHLDVSFPYRVGLHESCHGLRGARMASSSEIVVPTFSKWRYLLDMVDDIQLVPLERKDECCGFGGTFAIKESAISAKMGEDRLSDHIKHGAQYITSSDMSCLMHLEGLSRRKKWPVKVIHIAEILNGSNS